MRREETRTLILDTASELFYHRGYNLTGINEIIEKSGIAKATLYNHFKSKEDLMIAYLEKKDQELLKNLKLFCEERVAGDARLMAVLEFLIPFFHREDFNGCWCIRSIAEIPRENDKIRDKIQQNKRLFHAFIHRLVRENKAEISPNDQDKIANRLYLLYEAAITESHLHQAEWPILESLDLFKLILEKK